MEKGVPQAALFTCPQGAAQSDPLQRLSTAVLEGT